MKVSIGILCSVLGAAIAFYLAIISLVTLPADGATRWFAITGIAGLSLIAGLLVNGMSMQDYFTVSRAYHSLTSRLSPLLYSGIEDVLHRSASSSQLGNDLNFSVHVFSQNLLRTVGSTFPQGHSVWQQESRMGEGLRGYFAEAKIAGFSKTSLHTQGDKRLVFDRFGRQLGEIPVNRNAAAAEKWAYCKPIFERSTTTPWSSQVIGAIMVHSSADDADSLFKTEEFHNRIDSVAIEVSPYLDAIRVLVGEAKL